MNIWLFSLLFGCQWGSSSKSIQEGEVEGECADGQDNDSDGYIDCDDIGCWNKPACTGGDTGTPSGLDDTSSETGDSPVETGDTENTDSADSGETGAVPDSGDTADSGIDDTGDTGITPPPPDPVMDFSRLDVNPHSSSFGNTISPRDYLQQISGWYFIKAT